MSTALTRPHGGKPRIRHRSLLPLDSAAAGVVLLAHTDARLRGQFVRGPAAQLQGEPAARGDLRGAMAAVRAGGVAVVRDSTPERVRTVASPICDAQGVRVAGLSVVVPDEMVHTGHLVPSVLVAARFVARAIGEYR